MVSKNYLFLFFYKYDIFQILLMKISCGNYQLLCKLPNKQEVLDTSDDDDISEEDTPNQPVCFTD